MRGFRGIAESPIAPPTDMIWLYNREFKYFSNGQWLSITNPVGLVNEITEEATVKAPVIKIGNSTSDKLNNINVCKSVKLDNLDISRSTISYKNQYDKFFYFQRFIL